MVQDRPQAVQACTEQESGKSLRVPWHQATYVVAPSQALSGDVYGRGVAARSSCSRLFNEEVIVDLPFVRGCSDEIGELWTVTVFVLGLPARAARVEML